VQFEAEPIFFISLMKFTVEFLFLVIMCTMKFIDAFVSRFTEYRNIFNFLTAPAYKWGNNFASAYYRTKEFINIVSDTIMQA
jgi:hypothetical protein